MTAFFEDLLDRLRASGFRDLAGARATIDVPLTDVWLNQVIAAWIAHTPGPVREAQIRTTDDGRIDVSLRLTKFAFFPFTVRLVVDRQPEFPASPVAAFRWEIMSVGVAAFASRLLSTRRDVAPGIHVAGDRLVVDVAALLDDRGLAWLIPAIERLEVAPSAGRVMIHTTLAVPAVRLDG